MTFAATVSMTEVGYPESLATRDLRASFVNAISGLQLLQHCNITTVGLLPQDHSQFPAHRYAISPFYPNHTDETGSGWAAATVEVTQLNPEQRVLKAMILGFPALGGPCVEIKGKDLPQGVDQQVASVLETFATGSNQFLRENPLVATGLARLNQTRLAGSPRRRAIRHLNALVQKALKH